MKAFISYSHSDKDCVKKIENILNKNNVKYYIDEKFEYGEDITTSVHNSLNDCTHIFVVISPGSLKSHWVPYEIGYAHGLKEITVVPILTHSNMDIYSFISNLKYITITQEGFEKEFESYIINNKFISKKLPLNYELDYSISERLEYDNQSFMGVLGEEARQNIHKKNVGPYIKLKLLNLTDKNISIETVELVFRNDFSIGTFEFKIESMNAVEKSFFLHDNGDLKMLTDAYNFGIEGIKVKDVLNRELFIKDEFEYINKSIRETYSDLFNKKKNTNG